MGAVNQAVPPRRTRDDRADGAVSSTARAAAQRMLKFAFNLIDDGLVGQQLFAGEATRLAYMTEEAGRTRRIPRRDPDWSPFPWYYWSRPVWANRRPQSVVGGRCRYRLRVDWTGAIREDDGLLVRPVGGSPGRARPRPWTRDVDALVIDDGDPSVLRRLGFYQQHLLGMGQQAKPDQVRRAPPPLRGVGGTCRPGWSCWCWARVVEATLERRMHARSLGGATWPRSLLAQVGLLTGLPAGGRAG